MPYTRATEIHVDLMNFNSPGDNQVLTGTSSIVFTIDNSNLPSLTGMTYTPAPANPSTAAVNTDIVINFSELMDMSNDWTVTVVEANVPQTTEYTKLSSNAAWSGGGNTLTINPYGSAFGNLLRGDTITVTLTKFRAASDYAALTGTTTGSFAVNPIKPTVISYNPVNGANAVPVDKNIVLTFNERMNTTNNWCVTLSGHEFRWNSSGATWDVDGKILTINPPDWFLPRAQSVTVALSGFTAAIDEYPLQEPIQATFAVNPVMPVLVSSSPYDTEPDVEDYSPLIFTFNEKMLTSGWSLNLSGTTHGTQFSKVINSGGEWVYNAGTGNHMLTIANPGLKVNSAVNVQFAGLKAEIDNYPLTGDPQVNFHIWWHARVQLTLSHIRTTLVLYDACEVADQVDLSWDFKSGLSGYGLTDTLIAGSEDNMSVNENVYSSSVYYYNVERSGGSKIQINMLMYDRDHCGFMCYDTQNFYFAANDVLNINYDIANDRFWADASHLGGRDIYTLVNEVHDTWLIPVDSSNNNYIISFSNEEGKIRGTFNITVTPY